uniref:Putative phosphoglycerate mutase protein n=1 Tax=Trypanosoma congolense (strain IL3000) TaxID=1068625 RepID=G0ULZ2_TRYCI|nr:putative phosphoglycerate mutase protein [Trypanosoma congolense IL3000]
MKLPLLLYGGLTCFYPHPSLRIYRFIPYGLQAPVSTGPNIRIARTWVPTEPIHWKNNKKFSFFDFGILSSEGDMATVHICRHGQDEDNRDGLLNGRRDRPLTALGREQANRVADKLKSSGVSYDIILSSPLQRAYETACIIASALGKEVQKDEDLIERDFGVMTGKPINDIRRLAGENVLQGDKVLYFLDVKEAETFDQCFSRAARLLERVDNQFAGKRVLFVCHGDIGKMVQAVRKNITWRDALLLPYISNTDIVEL